MENELTATWTHDLAADSDLNFASSSSFFPVATATHFFHPPPVQSVYTLTTYLPPPPHAHYTTIPLAHLLHHVVGLWRQRPDLSPSRPKTGLLLSSSTKHPSSKEVLHTNTTGTTNTHPHGCLISASFFHSLLRAFPFLSFFTKSQTRSLGYPCYRSLFGYAIDRQSGFTVNVLYYCLNHRHHHHHHHNSIPTYLGIYLPAHSC